MKIGAETIFRNNPPEQHKLAYKMFFVTEEALDAFLSKYNLLPLENSNFVYLFIDNYHQELKNILEKHGWVEYQNCAGEIWFTHFSFQPKENKTPFVLKVTPNDIPIFSFD